MKRGLELIIGRAGGRICRPGSTAAAVIADDADWGVTLRRFCEREGSGGEFVTIYLAEDIVSHNDLELPLTTPDLEEAVAMQLGMLTPFEVEEAFFAFSKARGPEGYDLHLVTCGRSLVEPILKSMQAAGFGLRGLYPESQRYLTAQAANGLWAMILPGHIRRIAVFSGRHFVRMILSDSDLDHEKVMDLAGVEAVLTLPEAEMDIIASPPLLQQFNMLPRAYHRTDFSAMAMKGLAVAVGLALFVAMVGGFYHLHAVNRVLAARVAILKPEVEKVHDLDRRGRELKAFITAVDEVGVNPEIFMALTRLTRLMPDDSYLDQLQYDGGKEIFILRGFTEDVGRLTAALEKDMGPVKLKSTSRRAKKLYFQIEVGR